MAYTQADLDAIRAKITQAKTTAFADGRRVENHDLDQLMAAERVIEAALRMQERAQSGTVRRRFTPYYRSGL
jgi:hypothetical protein